MPTASISGASTRNTWNERTRAAASSAHSRAGKTDHLKPNFVAHEVDGEIHTFDTRAEAETWLAEHADTDEDEDDEES